MLPREIIEGNLDSVSFIASILFKIVNFAVSFGGIFATAAAVLRLAGYITVRSLPKFWLWVHDVREAAKSGAAQGGTKFNPKKLLHWLAMWLPDMWAIFAEEDDDTQTAGASGKQGGALRAAKFGTVVLHAGITAALGSALWMGTPMKILDNFTNGVNYFIDRAMSQYDIGTYIQQTWDGLISYQLITDNSDSPADQAVASLTKGSMACINTRFANLDKDSVQSLASTIESRLVEAVNANVELLNMLEGTEDYNVSYTAQLGLTTSKLNDAYKKVNGDFMMAESKAGAKSYKYYIPLDELLSGSTLNDMQENECLVYTLYATPTTSVYASANRIILAGAIEKYSPTSTSNLNAFKNMYVIPLSAVQLGATNNKLRLPGNKVAVAVTFYDADNKSIGTADAYVANVNGVESTSVLHLVLDSTTYNTYYKNAYGAYITFKTTKATIALAAELTDSANVTRYTVEGVRLFLYTNVTGNDLNYGNGKKITFDQSKFSASKCTYYMSVWNDLEKAFSYENIVRSVEATPDYAIPSEYFKQITYDKALEILSQKKEAK